MTNNVLIDKCIGVLFLNIMMIFKIKYLYLIWESNCINMPMNLQNIFSIITVVNQIELIKLTTVLNAKHLLHKTYCISMKNVRCNSPTPYQHRRYLYTPFLMTKVSFPHWRSQSQLYNPIWDNENFSEHVQLWV